MLLRLPGSLTRTTVKKLCKNMNWQFCKFYGKKDGEWGEGRKRKGDRSGEIQRGMKNREKEKENGRLKVRMAGL